MKKILSILLTLTLLLTLSGTAFASDKGGKPSKDKEVQTETKTSDKEKKSSKDKDDHDKKDQDKKDQDKKDHEKNDHDSEVKPVPPASGSKPETTAPDESAQPVKPGHDHAHDHDHSQEPAPQPAITPEEASGIALDSAGVEAGEASNVTCKQDKNHCTVEFTVGQVHYKYQVSTIDGTILKEEVSAPREVLDVTPVTKLQAEEAALAAAGLERGAVKGMSAYKEYSYGKASAYHVEFGVYDAAARQTTVYVYLLDIQTGEVLDANSFVPQH